MTFLFMNPGRKIIIMYIKIYYAGVKMLKIRKDYMVILYITDKNSGNESKIV